MIQHQPKAPTIGTASGFEVMLNPEDLRHSKTVLQQANNAFTNTRVAYSFKRPPPKKASL